MFTLFLVSVQAEVNTGNDALINIRPLVTFVFDDGYETDYTVAKDIFKAQGEPACAAITTGWVNTKNFLNISQISELQKDGWEILSHTVSHPKLKTLTEDRIETELSQSKSTLESWGFKVNNLVYPYNWNNETVKNIVRKYYRSGRNGHKMLNSSDLDKYDLKSYSNEISTRHKMSAIKSQIDQVYSEKKWLIFQHHRIDAKVKISNKNGIFIFEERLSFQPSGAVGQYIKDIWSIVQFIPLSGNPQAGDTVTGQSGGASGKLDSVIYNEGAALTEMIEYIHKNYPDMRIVTIDKGLDLMGLP